MLFVVNEMRACVHILFTTVFTLFNPIYYMQLGIGTFSKVTTFMYSKRIIHTVCYHSYVCNVYSCKHLVHKGQTGLLLMNKSSLSNHIIATHI